MARASCTFFAFVVAVLLAGCGPSPEQVAEAIGATATAQASIQDGIRKTQAAEPSPTTIPSATPMPTSTSTPRPRATSTPEGMRSFDRMPCYRWDTVTLDYVGKIMCVWGEPVRQRVDHANGMTWLYFGGSPLDFQFVTYAKEGYYETWDTEGMPCVYLEGKVHKIGNTPVMTMETGLYTCD